MVFEEKDAQISQEQLILSIDKISKLVFEPKTIKRIPKEKELENVI